MPLQSSGAISLNEIHIEAGGSSEAICTINDADIRDLIDKSSGATMAFNEWYGAAATIPWIGTRSLTAGGWSANSTIRYFTIASGTSGSAFGDLTVARQTRGGASNIARGIIMGGHDASNPSNVIDYVTIGSTGNATDFGDVVSGRVAHVVVEIMTNGTIALHAGGGDNLDIDYVTIASTGNSADFGQNMIAGARASAGISNESRGVAAGGWAIGAEAFVELIQYIPFAGGSDASTFGDLDQGAIYGQVGSEDSTRGIIAGGQTYAGVQQNAISYITIASTGDSTDAGDLPVASSWGVMNSDGVYAVATRMSPGNANDMQKLTIQSTSGAADVGDLGGDSVNTSGGCSGT